MEEYLRSNQLIVLNQAIENKTADVIRNAKSPKESSVKIFYYIRNARFIFGPPTLRTSVAVLDRFNQGKPDHCIGKTVLQAAMLRTARIPVRFRYLTFPISGWIDKKLFLGRAKGQLSCHPYLEVYQRGRWIACDATVDPTLKEPFICNEWDGEKSVRLQLQGVDCVEANFVSPHLPLEEIMDLISRYKKAFPLPLRPFAFRIGEWIITRNMNKFRKP